MKSNIKGAIANLQACLQTQPSDSSFGSSFRVKVKDISGDACSGKAKKVSIDE